MVISIIPAIISVVYLLIADLLWVNGVILKLYSALIQSIQSQPMTINYTYAVLSYSLMVIGLVVFVLPYATSVVRSLLYGALFGVIVYGIYNFTVAAVINNWSGNVIVVDLVWGATVYSTSALVYHVSTYFM